MNVHRIASRLFDLIDKLEPDHLISHELCSKDHLSWMCVMIMEDKVSEKKALVWIGYIQGILMIHHHTGLKEMREMVKDTYH